MLVNTIRDSIIMCSNKVMSKMAPATVALYSDVPTCIYYISYIYYIHIYTQHSHHALYIITFCSA